MPLAAGAALGAGYLESSSSGRQAQTVVFYVAGGRFYKIPASAKEGDLVRVSRERLKGEICYGVHSTTGQRMGYVPKDMVSILEGQRIVDARIIFARRFGVPWRRCRVRITLRPTVAGDGYCLQ